MIWTYVPGPGGRGFVAKCDNVGEYDRAVAHGTHLLDGQPARVSDLSDRDALLLRFDLASPWRPPTVRLRFEDHATAERVAAFGFHVFEGGLHRATLAGPGLLLLDRMFIDNPPPQYHGLSWRGEDASADKVKMPA